MPTWEEISRMNDEEIRAENKRLATKGLMMFMGLMAAKWAVIIGLNAFGRKLNKKTPPPAKVWIHI